MWIWRRILRQERWGKVDLDGKDNDTVFFSFFMFYLWHIHPNLSDTSSPCRRLHTALECRWWAHQRLCTHKVQFPANSTWKFSLPNAGYTPHPQYVTNPKPHNSDYSQSVSRPFSPRVRKCVGFDSKVQKGASLTLACNEPDKCTSVHWFSGPNACLL